MKYGVFALVAEWSLLRATRRKLIPLLPSLLERPLSITSLITPTCHTDAAKLAFTKAVKFYFRAQRHKNSGLADMVMDVMDVIEYLKLG
jgi:hypothetical protein